MNIVRCNKIHDMGGRTASGTMDARLSKYVGLRFNPDKYVFHLLLVLTLMFMVLYIVGTSVPAWYVLEERVSNISTCQSADRYLDGHVRRSLKRQSSTLLLTSSLWFINIRVSNNDVQYSRFVPFIFAQRIPLAERRGDGMTVENMFPKCLTTIVTFTFLGLGVAFTCCASSRPSRLIYYGLSAVMIIAAITSWVSIAITTSEKYLLSIAFDLCLQQGELKTSFLLQMVTGSSGILGFVFGCILIHLAILINNKVNHCEEGEDDQPLHEKIHSMYERVHDNSEKFPVSKVYNL